jgi:ribonuclease HI
MEFSEYFPEDKSKDSLYMECAALVSGLEKVVKLGVDKIEIRSDAQSMVQILCKENPVSEKYKILLIQKKKGKYELEDVNRISNKKRKIL